MSPTLLEVTVAVLLLWVAWQVGLLIAPHLIRYLRKTVGLPGSWNASAAPDRPEKNVTPPAPPSSTSTSTSTSTSHDSSAV